MNVRQDDEKAARFIDAMWGSGVGDEPITVPDDGDAQEGRYVPVGMTDTGAVKAGFATSYTLYVDAEDTDGRTVILDVAGVDVASVDVHEGTFGIYVGDPDNRQYVRLGRFPRPWLDDQEDVPATAVDRAFTGLNIGRAMRIQAPRQIDQINTEDLVDALTDLLRLAGTVARSDGLDPAWFIQTVTDTAIGHFNEEHPATG